jgi:hypothetical protein
MMSTGMMAASVGLRIRKDIFVATITDNLLSTGAKIAAAAADAPW